MSTVRPPWHELEAVAEGELVFRFVFPRDYAPSQAHGARVQLAAVASGDFKPNDKSYGASVYVKSKLPRGLNDLYTVSPKWRDYGVAELPVLEVRALKIEVRLTPQDCQYPSICQAHASLIGLDRPIRNALVKLIERHLVTPPRTS